MSIILYKKGDSYRSPKGIRCQIRICDPFSYEHLLEDGWFRTPEEIELDEKKKEVELDEKKKELAEVKDKKAKTIKRLKAKKAKLIAKQDKE